MSSQWLSVAEFAKVCQVTPRTIRWYQNRGLLKPTKIDAINKYAYFSSRQAMVVFKIKLLQQFNLSLTQIKTLIKNKPLSLNEELKRFSQLIKEMQVDYQFLKNFNSIFDSKKEPKLKLEKMGNLPLFCHKIYAGDYHKIDDYLQKLKQTAISLGIKYKNGAMVFYEDQDYNPKSTTLEVALICQRKIAKNHYTLPPNHALKIFPRQNLLTFKYKGPYNFIELIYQKLNAYVKKHKVVLKGPPLEHYLLGPNETKSPYDYLTKICYPV